MRQQAATRTVAVRRRPGPAKSIDPGMLSASCRPAGPSTRRPGTASDEIRRLSISRRERASRVWALLQQDSGGKRGGNVKPSARSPCGVPTGIPRSRNAPRATVCTLAGTSGRITSEPSLDSLERPRPPSPPMIPFPDRANQQTSAHASDPRHDPTAKYCSNETGDARIVSAIEEVAGQTAPTIWRG